MPLTAEQAADAAQEIIDTYLPIPEYFIEDILGARLWEKQIQIVQSSFKNKYTAVKTCNAVGKSYVAARIVVTYLMLHPDSIVVTTAPTWRQVTDILWREIAIAVKQSKFKLTNKEINQAGLNLAEKWYAVGLSTSRPENFFGYHADNILVVVDEAGGVDDSVFRGVAAITPNAGARVLLIGNPTSPTGTFYDAFTKKELGYKTFTISAFDTPNFTKSGLTDLQALLKFYTPPIGVEQYIWTAEKNAELALKVDKLYLDNLIHPSVVYQRYFELGTDNPYWQSLIMGEFPDQAEQSLFPANLVRESMKMYDIDPQTKEPYFKTAGWMIPQGPPEYGQDMARFGNDRNVNYPRRGGWVEKANVWNKKGDVKKDLMESAAQILDIIDPLDDNVIVNIDDTGNGGGTTDRLNQLNRESQHSGMPAHRYRLIPYVFGSKERMSEAEKVKFADITSKLYWNLRSWFYNKQIALHFDQDLFDELVDRRWGMTKDGKIKVESKDEYKKRTGGRSPDLSDALALAFASTGTIKPADNIPPPTKEQELAAILNRRRYKSETSGLQSRY